MLLVKLFMMMLVAPVSHVEIKAFEDSFKIGETGSVLTAQSGIINNIHYPVCTESGSYKKQPDSIKKESNNSFTLHFHAVTFSLSIEDGEL